MPKLKAEQSEVISHEQGNILISASAGSGKTFVMIERLIRLIVEKKTKVKNVLCVTFTESAAREMKEKLKTALIKKIKEGQDLGEELLDVETADICTIHSFCSRVLRKYFFSAGVSPDFKIADQEKTSVLIKDSINKVFTELYEKKDEAFIELLKRHGKYRSDAEFKKLIVRLHGFTKIEVDFDEFVKKCIDLYDDFDGVKNKYKELLNCELNGLKNYLLDLKREAQELEFVKAVEIITKIEETIEDALISNVFEFKKYEQYKTSMYFGQKIGQEKEAVKEQIKEVYTRLTALFKRVNANISTESEEREKAVLAKEHLSLLFNVVKAFDECYSRSKEQENLLDFNDLEHFALKALKDEQTLEAIRENYQYIFADEYQDVNAVQEEILSKISNDNLFMVGDVKQSIYGFRGCRPEIFQEKEQLMKKNGQKTVRLNFNFRSADKILEAVNEIFSYSMTDTVYGTDYSQTATLKAGGIYQNQATGRSELHVLTKNQEKKDQLEKGEVYNLLERISEKQEEKPSDIALLIESIIRKELNKTYYNPKTEKFQQITYSDIVILNKNRDNAYVFKLVSDLIKLNVPLSTDVTENVCSYPEIQTLIGLLNLIDCKAEDLSLVTILKSPVGNFTDEELLEISLFFRDIENTVGNDKRRKMRFFNAYEYAVKNLNNATGDKLRKFDEYIENVRKLADFLGAYGILKKVMDDCSFESYLVAKGHGKEKLDRISFFISKSKNEERNRTVHDFLKLIKDCPDAFLLSPATKENSVRIMTIHASKGLEFPVVIVCGLEKGTNSLSQREEVLQDNQLGFAVKNYFDNDKTYSENLFRATFKEKMRIEKIREDLRLFYVATTRASYSMHLTLEVNKDKRRNVFIGAEKFYDYIPRSMNSTEVYSTDLSAEINKREARKVLVGRVNQQKRAQIEKDLYVSYPLISSSTLPLKISVTEANLSHEKVDYGKEDYQNSVKTGIERGVVAHKIIEQLDFDRLIDKNDFNAQIEEMIETNAVTKEQVAQLDLDCLARAIKVILTRVKGKKIFKEKSFMAEVDANEIYSNQTEKILVQGVIDLLVLDDNEAEIIDYKYSSLSGERLKNKYQKQLDLYASATECALKVKVKRKTLINLLSGETVDW